MITNSSFKPSKATPSTASSAVAPQAEASNPSSHASAFVLPSFQYIPTISTEDSAVQAFIKGFVLPHKLHNQHDRLSRAEKNILLREPEFQGQFVGARKVDEILVLICGHGGRDERCGKLGPILGDEFEEKLQRQNVALLHDAPVPEAAEINTEVEGYVPTARVGMISHIGGHKWAGNVIIYIPPSFSANPLAGKGIWYGRVEPQHVEGIVGKTIMDGKVIKELFRGGIDQGGEMIRL